MIDQEPNVQTSQSAEPSVNQPAPLPVSAPARHPGLVLSIVSLAAYLAMVITNALANILPINGLMTGDISDSYPNLFAPAGVTFAIWGLIYVLLAAFTLYQFLPAASVSPEAAKRLKWTQVWFVISSLANTAWIFMWHYLLLPVSLALMLVILISLILISLKYARTPISLKEAFFVRLPFSVYFGWITVATVANVTSLLADIGWDGFGLGDVFWTSAILVVASVIGLAVIISQRNWAYGAVIAWAYAGILIKHLDETRGFAGEYTAVIITVSICLGFVAAASILALFGRHVKLVANAKT